MSAERQRRHRARRKAGLMVLDGLEVFAVDHVEMLIEGKWLRREDEDDQAAVRAATSRLLVWLGRPAANDA